MEDLNKNDYFEINGGSFAKDAGWFLGHILSGDLLPQNYAGYAKAIADYTMLYM